MNNATAPFDEIRELVAALNDGRLDAAEQQRLEQLVVENVVARRYYLQAMFLVGKLHRTLGGQDLEEGGRQRAEGGDEDAGLRGQGSESNPQPLIPNPSFIPPIILDSTPSPHIPIGSFIFSHIAAAVILGIGLLIGLAWRISLPSSEGPAPDTRSTAVAQEVGRITALAECMWSRQDSEVGGPGSGISKTKDLRPKTVYLGDRFLLSSGLMEITYDTGAKVILQGPCTYEIDSDRSGFLAVGRLTAKVEKREERRGERGESQANHKSEIINHKSHSPLSPLLSPLFAVRTPTAIVTDLGTEFGVEVEKSGATRSHVFQGSVEVRPAENRNLQVPLTERTQRFIWSSVNPPAQK